MLFGVLVVVAALVLFGPVVGGAEYLEWQLNLVQQYTGLASRRSAYMVAGAVGALAVLGAFVLKIRN